MEILSGMDAKPEVEEKGEPKAKEITFVETKAVLVEKFKKEHVGEVRELLQKYRQTSRSA